MSHLKDLASEYQKPKRRAISSRYPILVRPAVFTKRLIRTVSNRISLTHLEKGEPLRCVVARHSSLLYRKLGDSDMVLQKNKVTNLAIAISHLDGLIIPPGKTFSFWDAVGHVSAKDGYVDGMLLSEGKVSKGIGGGLCQLSNFLMWIFLHADIEIVERHHHSVDAFPDSGRILPFGSGATIYDNYLDLKIKNISNNPLQLKIWLTDMCLKGQLLSDIPQKNKYHLIEKNHCFVRSGDNFFRYNEIFREKYENGRLISEEKIFTNFAPVVYPVNENHLKELGYEVVRV